jgi:hypothetical protein
MCCDKLAVEKDLGMVEDPVEAEEELPAWFGQVVRWQREALAIP